MAGDARTVQDGLGGLLDPEQRISAVWELGEELTTTAVLDAWVAQAGTYEALAVRGRHRIALGWAIRGSGRGRTVGHQQFEGFHGWLRAAERDLFDAAALDPSDPTAWSVLLVSARGLEVSDTERWARLARVQELAPWSTVANGQMLQNLCAKWSGSHEAMFDFARQVSAAAPAAHPVHGLVPQAITERWLDESTVEGWRAARAALPQLGTWLHEAAMRSIDLPEFHAHHPHDPERLRTLNEFAGAYARLNDQPRLRWTLERIGTNTTHFPWAYAKAGEVQRLRRLVNLDA